MIHDTTDTQTVSGSNRRISPTAVSDIDDEMTTQEVVDSETLKSDVQKLGQNLRSDSKELVEDVKIFAKTQVIDPAIAKAKGHQAEARLKASEAELKMRRRTEEAKRVAENEYRRGLQMVRDKPAAAMAIAAVAGAILGRFLLRR